MCVQILINDVNPSIISEKGEITFKDKYFKGVKQSEIKTKVEEKK